MVCSSRLGSDNIEDDFVITDWRKPIGIVAFKVYDDTAYIRNIRIADDYKRKHYATQVIACLLSIHGVLMGDAVPTEESLKFWDNIGAEFDEDIQEYIDNDTCIPFTVYG